MNTLSSIVPVCRVTVLRVSAVGLIVGSLLAAGCRQESLDPENPPESSGTGDRSGHPPGKTLPGQAVTSSAQGQRPTPAPKDSQQTRAPREETDRNPAAPTDDQQVPAAKKRKANRLARETSPYLLLHAHNPVDWYPWGPEAFEAAKREDRPIFLSIGYSSCYWCHVMERLVFENEDIARFMNENFVNIKVDREERPDVDDIYMTSLQVYFSLAGSGQGGGWPLSMFLTPDGKPIAGGTYFPPESKDGRPGFLQLCERIHEVWKTRREEVEQGGETIARIVRQEMKPAFSLEQAEITEELVETVTRTVVQSHDVEYGGLDFQLDRASAPKFPVPTKLALLQYELREHDQARDTEHALYGTLDAMAAGGIRDHLGGGFHRYSTDRKWLVPHFEKMLYDNAQLADIYAEAWRATKQNEYRQVAEEIFHFILTSMREPGGAFHSALDAETNAIEGEYYVWSRTEVEQTLGPAAPLFLQVYGFEEPNDFEHGFILHLPRSLAQVAVEQRISPPDLSARLRDSRRRLLEIRHRRELPLKDDKILTAWNGLMIRSLAHAGMLFNRSDYIAAAEEAAMFIVQKMRDEDGRLLRTFRADEARLNAYLDDYAFFTEGLLVLHEATRNPRSPERGQRWLNAARRLTDDQLEMFWDESGDGFFFTSHHHEALLARTKNAWDSVLPSGNSVSVRNLIRLASLTGDQTYREKARKTLELFAPAMKKNPRGMTNMAIAMSEYLDNPDFRPLIDAASRPTLPEGTAPEPGQTPAQPAPAEPGTVPDGQRPETSKPPAEPAAATADKVTAEAFLNAARLVPGQTTRIAFLVNVAEGWHINPNPSAREAAIPTSVRVDSELGTKLKAIRYPDPITHVVDGDVLEVYEGKIRIFADLEVPAGAAGQREKLQIHIRYQACTDQFCDRPRTVSFSTGIDVAEAGVTVSQQNAAIFQDDQQDRSELPQP